MTKVVGILGFKNAGKDEVARILVSEFGFHRDSFARPVKDALSAIFGWDRYVLEGITPEQRAQREIPDPWWSEKLGRPWSMRIAMQTFGTDVCRNHLHRDLWTLSMENRLRKWADTRAVISDARFRNEIDLVRSLGGIILRVRRGPEPDWYAAAEIYNTISDKMQVYPLPGAESILEVHESERAWIGTPVDILIENDGSLEDLRCKVISEMGKFSVQTLPS